MGPSLVAHLYQSLQWTVMFILRTLIGQIEMVVILKLILRRLSRRKTNHSLSEHMDSQYLGMLSPDPYSVQKVGQHFTLKLRCSIHHTIIQPHFHCTENCV
jgi:hypothetical protein